LINGCFHPLCRNFLSNFYQTFLFDTKGHFGIKVHQISDTVAWVSEMEQLDTRRILKRLAKENLKQLGRMVAKIAHANPMTVLRTIVHQVGYALSCLTIFLLLFVVQPKFPFPKPLVDVMSRPSIVSTSGLLH
jgi:hypothetical protein